MNRRNFLKNILVAGASFSILPGAGRIWHAKRPHILEIQLIIDYSDPQHSLVKIIRFELSDGHWLTFDPDWNPLNNSCKAALLLES